MESEAHKSVFTQSGKILGNASLRAVCRRHQTMRTPPGRPTPSCQLWTSTLTSFGCPNQGTQPSMHARRCELLTGFPSRSIPDPTPSTMTALHQFGAEMLKLSRGLESFAPVNESSDDNSRQLETCNSRKSPARHKANPEWYARTRKNPNRFLI